MNPPDIGAALPAGVDCRCGDTTRRGIRVFLSGVEVQYEILMEKSTIEFIGLSIFQL